MSKIQQNSSVVYTATTRALAMLYLEKSSTLTATSSAMSGSCALASSANDLAFSSSDISISNLFTEVDQKTSFSELLGMCWYTVTDD